MAVSWSGLVGYIERSCTSGTGTFHDTSADALDAVGARQGQAHLHSTSPRCCPPPPIPPTDPGARASQFGASQTESVKVLVRDQRDQILLEISRSDWDGFDHAVHGASPDLIVGLCLRKRLGSSELPRLDLMSADAFVLSRGVWPASWEELSYFAAAGGSFQVRSILRGGMDPGRQVALAAVNFKDSTDWTLLERLYAQVHVVPQ